MEALKNDIKHETHVASSKQYAALQARQERLAAELVPLRQAAEAARRDAEQERLGREAAEAKVGFWGGVRGGVKGGGVLNGAMQGNTVTEWGLNED